MLTRLEAAGSWTGWAADERLDARAALAVAQAADEPGLVAPLERRGFGFDGDDGGGLGGEGLAELAETTGGFPAGAFALGGNAFLAGRSLDFGDVFVELEAGDPEEPEGVLASERAMLELILFLNSSSAMALGACRPCSHS
jgi:hypothetical protein